MGSAGYKDRARRGSSLHPAACGLTGETAASMLAPFRQPPVRPSPISYRSMSEQPSPWLSDHVAGVILAGGRNSRMGGRDKAFLQIDGQTVFARTLALLQRCFAQVVVVSNTPEKYAGFDVEV